MEGLLRPASPVAHPSGRDLFVSRQAVLDWLVAYATLIEQNKDVLTELDAAIGDADHGYTLNRGWQAVLSRLGASEHKDIGGLLKLAGMTLVSTVGGASGPLYGTLFICMGASAGCKLELTLADWAAVLEAGTNGVVARGRASLGDKTMVDTLAAAAQALNASTAAGTPLPAALRHSAEAARQGMLNTIPLPARRARASYLSQRGIGHQDPGATSSYLLLKAAADTWA